MTSRKRKVPDELNENNITGRYAKNFKFNGPAAFSSDVTAKIKNFKRLTKTEASAVDCPRYYHLALSNRNFYVADLFEYMLMASMMCSTPVTRSS